MTEPTNEELAEALRSIEGLPLGTQLVVRLAADRLCPPVVIAECGSPEWDLGDGWITANGVTEPNLPSGAIVEVKFRDGDSGLWAIGGTVENWNHTDPCGADIIAYRIVGAP